MSKIIKYGSLDIVKYDQIYEIRKSLAINAAVWFYYSLKWKEENMTLWRVWEIISFNKACIKKFNSLLMNDKNLTEVLKASEKPSDNSEEDLLCTYTLNAY